jgi:hypothetical protein
MPRTSRAYGWLRAIAAQIFLLQLRVKFVSIVPLLLAVVAGQEEEQRATHESRLQSPPPRAVPHTE